MNGREEILTSALKIVTQDRNSTYGEPEDNFGKIAELWESYIRQAKLCDRQIVSYDVAIMMVLMKVARLTHDPNVKDSWMDIAGYAACGYDCTIQTIIKTVKGDRECVVETT